MQYLNRLGIPQESLSKNHDNFMGLHCLTTLPEPGLESCGFYISEISRESPDVEGQRCTFEDVVFDKSVVLDSIPTDFKLVWNHSDTNSIVGALSDVGGLMGSLCGGYLADINGRKPVMFAGVFFTQFHQVLNAMEVTF